MKKDKDQLEKFIGDNLDSFNQETPGDDVWKNIKPDLPKKGRITHLPPWKNILKIAAAITIIAGITSTLLFIVPNQKNQQPTSNVHIQTTLTLKDISPEYAEVQNYYEEQINSKMNELKKQNLDEENFIELSTYDEEFKSLEKELRNSVDQQKIIDAMIQNYRIKLDNMDNMLNRIKNIDNTTDHEKNSTDILVFV